MFKFSNIIFFVLIMLRPAFGQNNPADSLRSEFDKLYGLDVLLNNGRKYFAENNPVIGFAFWKSNDPYQSSITIGGKEFNQEKVRFNLYSQEFVLSYTNLNGQNSQVILNNEAIDSVRIDDALFIPNTYPEIKQKFVQQIHQGKLSCFVGWYKDLQFNRTGVNVGYMYSKDQKSNYLILNGVVKRFHSKASFLKIFDRTSRLTIRKYISSRHFRFRKISEKDLKDLILYSEKTVY